jgi:hypothetical protein
MAQIEPATSPSRPRVGIWTCLLSLVMCIGCPGIILLQFYSGFRRVKEDVQSGLCLKNMRDLARAHQMYAADNMHTLPPGEVWMDVVEPYLKDNIGALGCPIIRTKDKSKYGIAMNEIAAGKPLAVVMPMGKLPLVFDSTLMHRNAVGSISTLPDPGRHVHNAGEAGWERERNTIAFVNGAATETYLRSDFP